MSGEILRADVVSQAKLLADAQEQPRAEVAAAFLQQIERVSVLTAHRRAGEADDQHGLLFIARLDDALWRSEKSEVRSPNRFGRVRIFSPISKSFFDGGPDFAGFHVAVNRQHAVVRHGQLLVKRFQVGDGNLPDRFLRAQRIQAVAGVAEQRAAHGEAGALE